MWPGDRSKTHQNQGHATRQTYENKTYSKPARGELRAECVICNNKSRARSSRADPPSACDDGQQQLRAPCLGFITKTDRGVVRGLGEIKILHGGIPSPQKHLRAELLKTQRGSARS